MMMMMMMVVRRCLGLLSSVASCRDFAVLDRCLTDLEESRCANELLSYTLGSTLGASKELICLMLVVASSTEKDSALVVAEIRIRNQDYQSQISRVTPSLIASAISRQRWIFIFVSAVQLQTSILGPTATTNTISAKP